MRTVNLPTVAQLATSLQGIATLLGNLIIVLLSQAIRRASAKVEDENVIR
jgi:hypothetical protein